MDLESEIVRTREGWWVLRHDTHLSRWIEQTGRLDHDQAALARILPHIKPGSLVIDAGAALGDHTHAYLNAVGPQGLVVAFEPHPVEFECLRRNCPTALCLPYAVGETEDEAWLFHEPNIIGSSRLIDPSLGEPMSKVRRVTIDRNYVLEPSVSFMKIDIEGSEPEALRGARETILKHRPVIWIEINPAALERQGHSAAELRDVLENQLYYRVAEFYPPDGGWNGHGDTQCDCLCVPM